MILIATDDDKMAKKWQGSIAPLYPLYDGNIRDRHALEVCLKKVPFDVVILDMGLLGEEGITEIAALRELQPQIHIVLMTRNPYQREEITAILFGAKAYCPFDLRSDLLPKVIKTVLANELWVDRKFVSRLLIELENITQIKQAEAQQLNKGVATMTPRENEIASLVATGASNRRIAEQLCISERTVKAHLGVIFRKININDRLQLALYMNRHQQIAALWRGN